jgi:hypothetical protein
MFFYFQNAFCNKCWPGNAILVFYMEYTAQYWRGKSGMMRVYTELTARKGQDK